MRRRQCAERHRKSIGEEERTPTEIAGERGLGSESVGPGWRDLTCVGDSGPSVSDELSTELEDASSLVGSPAWGKLYRWKKGSPAISSSSPGSPMGSLSVPSPRFLGIMGAEYARVLRPPGRCAVEPALLAALSLRSGCILCALLAFSLRFDVCSAGAALDSRAAWVVKTGARPVAGMVVRRGSGCAQQTGCSLPAVVCEYTT